ncbi:BON domain-containing protein [Polynucleobacter sp. AP-Latsch-80-C2]|jgi:osmotically-inducible protein OsmY|uniref:BON domain-containing protein n=1 Tax=Polynucleobacter sp. AP-Latsch-80-C2 TaxID=2576931 RepID=UPI001C0C7081|nr:BON domain-containing protein [Polynucleobacter sp. AP-Latsch-80-C2]MBU3622224.1 BON domain-containing protein [Polynucleobacter sp. AP-Latsch-80-C2]
MKMDNSFKAVFASMMIISGLAACDNPGPAEKAGKKIDQVTENVSTSVSNAADKAVIKQANKTGQAIDDSTITVKVKSALLTEPGMQLMKITVVTEKGIVTLSGSADSQINIDKAIKLAAAIEGVQSVKSKLAFSK